jgi:hypothetical protein
VRFHIRSGDRTVTAAAKRMEDVELTQFLNDKDFILALSGRPPEPSTPIGRQRERKDNEHRRPSGGT